MKYSLPYGSGPINIEIPDKNLLGVFEPKGISPSGKKDILYEAVRKPQFGPPIGDFLKGSKNLLIIVNDATRSTPTAEVIELIYNDITRYPHKFIIATGTHPTPSEDEREQIFGKRWQEIRNDVFLHNAKNEKELVHIGRSPYGNDLMVNKLVMEADRLITINSVEPHYFAGYTGGRKCFLPGVAGYKTVESNHKLAMEPGSKTMALAGNPVHEEMEYLANLVIKKRPVFSVQIVLDDKNRVFAAASGDLNKTFEYCVEKANSVFTVNTGGKADIIIAVSKHPLDVDLYQSHKAIENAKLILKEDGVIILVSQCRKGIGNDEFYKLMQLSSTPEEVLKSIKKGYKLGYHKAAKLAELATWGHIWGYTGLPEDVLKKVFIRPITDIQKGIDEALGKRKNAMVAILPDAGLTVPRANP